MPSPSSRSVEGISYLVVVGVVAYSLYTKVNTGKGLPAGPSGLLGAVEGLSYLSLLGGESLGKKQGAVWQGEHRAGRQRHDCCGEGESPLAGANSSACLELCRGCAEQGACAL